MPDRDKASGIDYVSAVLWPVKELCLRSSYKNILLFVNVQNHQRLRGFPMQSGRRFSHDEDGIVSNQLNRDYIFNCQHTCKLKNL